MRKEWLEQGYKDFAEGGPENLSVNHMAKEIGASRSSFYHHFGDMEIFIDSLLEMHLEIALAFNETGAERCKKLIPDLYELLAEYNIPLKFARQLFHHRQIPRYNYLFNICYQSSGEAFLLRLFTKRLGLEGPSENLKHLWLTLGEAWYSRLDPEDLSAQTMQQHAESILQDISVLMDSGLYSTLRKVY